MNTHDYYPHMIVGNPRKISVKTLTNYSITYGDSDSTLVDKLIAEKRELKVYKKIVRAIIETSDIVNNKSDLLDLFSDFDNYLEMFMKNDEDSIVVSSITDSDFTKHKSKLWDSLIVHFIDNTRPEFYQTLVYGLKMISLFEKINDNTLDTNQLILDYWNKSKLILPKSIFPLPKIKTEILPKETADDTTPNLTQLHAELKKFKNAKEDILLRHDIQNQSLKNEQLNKEDYIQLLQDTINKDDSKTLDLDFDEAYQKYSKARKPLQLISEHYNKLKSETITTITTLGIPATEIDVAFVTEKIDKKCRELSQFIANSYEPEIVVQIGDSLVTVENAFSSSSICVSEIDLNHCSLLHDLNAKNKQQTYVQVLGTGNANIIRQQLIKYEATEIAHIENVLAGEVKEKTHRNLKIKEEYYSSETEKSEETETDTKTTDRFELSKEINKITSTADQFNAGLTLSGSYGTVSFGATVGYASQNASSEANSTSVSNSKEVTKSAVSRIQERVFEKRSVASVNEIEVTNLHSIKNDLSGAKHISGMYYWIDKVYENQVYNIGKRMMLEFLVPEPAAYLIYSQTSKKNEGKSFIKPIAPSLCSKITGGKLKSPMDIDRYNYSLWAALYNAQDVVPPPPKFFRVSKAYSQEVAGNKNFINKDYNDLKIKDGYVAKTAYLQIGMSNGVNRYIEGHVGFNHFRVSMTTNNGITIPLSDEIGVVPLSFRGSFDEFNMNVEILCELTEETEQKWKIQTYNSIMNAYINQKEEYEYRIESHEEGIAISGQNPILNRKTEKTELKKWGIEMLTLQRFNNFNAMKRAKNGHPEIDFEKASKESEFVKFFEQSIEWHNMTYLLYPYFWSPKNKWTVLKQFNDTDPKFTDFLQAGYARVVVPVHPKFNEAIMHYLKTGEIWKGEELPAIDDELYLSIIDEIKEAEERKDDDPVGDPWETRIPTNMVMLSDVIPADLPGSGV